MIAAQQLETAEETLQRVDAERREAEAREEEARCYHFPHGLAGFPEDRRFAFLYPGYGDYVCLQSLDHVEVAFVLTPWDQNRLGLPPTLSPEEIRLLRLRPGDVPIWMLVLNPFSDSEWVTANLRAPIVVNEQARIALQSIRPEEKEIRFPWVRKERH